MADRHSKASLVFWFAACLVVTAAGVWLLSLGESVVFGLLVIAFGCLAAVAWGYTLLLRFTK
jgi:hypothetical protein